MSILPGDSNALLDAVHGLEPLIREHADDAERNHRLSQPVVAGLAKAGLFRMLTPQRLGGFEVPPLTFFRVVEETARIDGSTGWCLFIGGGIPVQGAFIGDAASVEIFGRDPHMIGAGAVFVQSKLNCTSVEGIGAVGVKAKTKLCAAPGPMSTGVFGVPVI